jgi:epoxyqueuosine reductase
MKLLSSQNIKEKALQIGFSACGITDAESLSLERKTIFSSWIKEGYHADMHYLERNLDKRLQPQLLFEGTQSIIVVLLNYHSPQYFKDKKSSYLFSQYALGQDYHNVMKNKLHSLTNFITKYYPQSKNRSFVDSAPVLEKHLAYKAGLGTIGKNSLLLTPKGSYFFIGEIFTSIPLSYDKPFSENYCNNCNLCISACPTKALTKPYYLNANKCISYQTIENKNSISKEISDKIGKHVYGCDICQQVCPQNKLAEETQVEGFHIKEPFLQWTDSDWEDIQEKNFRFCFSDSVLFRPGIKKLKENILSAKEK